MKNFLFIFCWTILTVGYAQRNFDEVEITSEKLTDKVYVLFGAGGNIGLIVGKDAAYLIDDQFGPLTPKIVSHVKTITDKPLNFVLNTHHHGDHTGGNENLANNGATIIAHENVRELLEADEKTNEAAYPVITFNDKMTLYLGDNQRLLAMHVNPAHTKGDTYYYLPEANVIHMGDNFFAGRYPYIDIKSGGDIDGLISNVTMALGMLDENTIIIPGHGSIANISDLEDYKNVLVELRKRVKKAREAGNSLEATQQMNLSKEWNATHGTGFINAERIVEFIYKSAD